MTDTAVAVREERHPIIAQIDDRMPEIAEILPDGMKPERFRKVVVQALLRNPDLWACTPISVVTAITEAAEVGIEPTGVLGKGWLLPYNVNIGSKDHPKWEKQAKFIPGWRGFVDLCWRADRILLTPELVRQGDAFEYRRGTGAFLHHVPVLDDQDREKSDANVTFAYVIVRFPDGREDFEVMSRAALERIRDRAKKKNPVWESDPGEMFKKTPLRRIAKRLPLSPAVQRMLAGDEEVDFETPVERVADPQRDALRERIASRTAAIRGGEPIDPGESEGRVLDAAADSGAQPEGAASSETFTPSGGSPARAGDPWMRRLHAVANDRGMDHDALHDWAVQHFRVGSLTDLDTLQRATFMEIVERMPVLDTSVPSVADQDAPASDEAGVAHAPASIQSTEGGAGDAPAPVEPEPVTSPPGDAAPANDSVPVGEGSPPGSQPAPFTDPANLETYAAMVLGFETPQPLKELTDADFDAVFSALAITDYGTWFEAQERPIRQALRVARQAPRQRADRAKEAAKRPDAEQLRAAIGSESGG